MGVSDKDSAYIDKIMREENAKANSPLGKATGYKPIPADLSNINAPATEPQEATVFGLPFMWGRNAEGKSEIQYDPRKGAVPRQIMEGALAVPETLWEAAEASQKLEPAALTAARLFLPKRWVEGIPGSVKVEPKSGELSKRFVDSEIGEDGKVRHKPATPSGKFNEMIAPAIRGAGGGVVMPGSFWRNFIVGAGAGEGGHLGSTLGHRLDIAVGNDKDNPVFEEIGGMAGGAAGGQVNMVKSNAIGQLAKPPVTGVKNIVEAYGAAKKAKAAGDQRSTWQLMGDYYAPLRAEGLGIIQQYVYENFAKVLQEDPKAMPALRAFDDNAKALGLDLGTFNLAQRTANPTLVKSVEFYRPKDMLEQNKNIQAQVKDVQALKDVYERLTRDTGVKSPQHIADSFEDFRHSQNLRLVQQDEGARQVRSGFANFGPDEYAQKGATLKDLFDKERTVVKGDIDKLYKEVEGLAGMYGTTFDLRRPTNTAQNIVNSVLTALDPQGATGVPTNLANLVDKMGKGTGYSMRDVLDIKQALNQAIFEAGRSTDASAATRGRNLNILKDELSGVIDKQAPAQVKAALELADKTYAENYVPLAKTGENFNLRREGGVSNLNNDFRDNAVVLDNYLTPGGKRSATTMKDFDNAFNGKNTGGKPVSEAYTLLGETLESRYQKTVLDNLDKFTPEAHDQFMKDYKPVFDAIERVNPGIREKFTLAAERFEELNNIKEQTNKWYKEVTGGDVSKSIGVMEAGKLFSEALSDPRKMGQVIRAFGKDKSQALVQEVWARGNPFSEIPDSGGRLMLDSVKLSKMLDAGRDPGNPQSASSVQILLRDVLGKERGDNHYRNLERIAAAGRRVEETTPLFDKPLDRWDQDAKIGGQSVASQITLGKSVGEGRISPLYYTIITGGRFFNSKVKNALEDATRKALYDPDAAKAILELVETPNNKPITQRTAERVFGAAGKEGKSFMAELLDKGQIRANAAKGAIIGGNTQEEEVRRKEVKNGKAD